MAQLNAEKFYYFNKTYFAKLKKLADNLKSNIIKRKKNILKKARLSMSPLVIELYWDI